MIAINENIERAKWLSQILVSKLGPDYLIYTQDLNWIETIFAYIRANKNKRKMTMKENIKKAVAEAWMRWQTHMDPYELFIDAGIYTHDITLQDFTSS